MTTRERRSRCTPSAGATRPRPPPCPRPRGAWSSWPSGSTRRPAVDSRGACRAVRARPDELLDALRGVLGAEHVLTDDETRRLRTRGKSTPDLLRARAGDLTDAPDAVVRPGTHDEVAAVLACAVEHHVAVVPVRWRHVGDRRPGRAPRRLRRAWSQPRPGPDEAAASPSTTCR